MSSVYDFNFFNFYSDSWGGNDSRFPDDTYDGFARLFERLQYEDKNDEYLSCIKKMEQYCKQQPVGYRWDWNNSDHIAFCICDWYNKKDGTLLIRGVDYSKLREMSFKHHNRLLVLERLIEKVLLFTFHKDSTFLADVVNCIPNEYSHVQSYDDNIKYRKVKQEKDLLKEKILDNKKRLDDTFNIFHPDKFIIFGDNFWQYGICDLIPYKLFNHEIANEVFARQEDEIAKIFDPWIRKSKIVSKKYKDTLKICMNKRSSSYSYDDDDYGSYKRLRDGIFVGPDGIYYDEDGNSVDEDYAYEDEY